MSEHDEASRDIRLEMEQLSARPVVSLRRYRDLRDGLARAKADELLRDLKTELNWSASWMYRYHGDALITWIESCARRRRVPERRSTASLARWVARQSYFRRTSQKIRKWYAYVVEVPFTEVSAHIRDGRPVGRHFRLLGAGHLVPLAAADTVAGDVLRQIISGAHRKPRPPSR
jgi:hypothetical protein